MPKAKTVTKATGLDGLTKASIMSAAKSTMTKYVSAMSSLNLTTVHALFFAAKHGDCDALNYIYSKLRPNDQQALKLAVRRIHIVIGMGLNDGNIPAGLTGDMLSEKATAGSVLKFSNKKYKENGTGWSVRNNSETADGTVAANKVRFAEICENDLVKPDPEKGWQPIYDRNNLSEVKVLGDTEALKTILQAVKTAMGETDKDNLSVVTSPGLRSELGVFKERLEQFQSVAKAQAEATVH